MYSPYSFNYNITSIFYYRHIDNSLYQKEWDVNVVAAQNFCHKFSKSLSKTFRK